MERLRILIAGAGLGGLAAAAQLALDGHRVEVYEQAAALGEVGAGIQLSANAMHGLAHLGLKPEIDRLGVRPGAYVFRLHDTGETIQRFALSAEHERLHGAPYTQMHRADLHELLAAKARSFDPGMIRLNARAVGFEEQADGVTLLLADGRRIAGDLLIGADGVKSVIRDQIAGKVPATYAGDAAWRLTVPVERLPPGLLEPVMSVFMGPGRHAVFYYLRAGALLNFVGLVETDEVSEESWTVRFPWENLRDDFAGWHPVVQTVIAAADRGECFRWSLHTRPPIPNWSTPHATLLGDSAHATLPYLAQGAAMAMEDGVVLARALRLSPSVPEALRLYQRNRIARTSKIVAQSGGNRDLFHMSDQAAMRAAFARRDEGRDRNAWLYAYNPLTVELV